MSSTLPDRPHLDHLKGQAKQLQLALQKGDPDALSRVGESKGDFKLADAQRTIAREYGFASWAKLKRYVEGYADRVEAFFAAIRAGDRSRVLEMLTTDPALARSRNENEFGEVPLTCAAQRGDKPMIELLLEKGADPNAKSDWWAGGFCPLDFCHPETARYLISRGARLTAHAAARLGWAEELRRILDAEPGSVDERGGDGQFPLHFASTPEIVDILIDAGADLEARDLDHEGTAAQFNVLESQVLRRLVERGAQVDVFMAIVLGDDKRLRQLLENDPDSLTREVGESGSRQIPQAPGGHIYIYRLGAVCPHQLATQYKSASCYKVLWERSSPPQRLAMAAYAADDKTCRSLIANDPNLVEKLSHKDQTSLPYAAWVRRTNAVKVMLGIGFDPNVQGREDSTAIDRAAFHGFDDVIEAILPFGPRLEIQNCYGGTPLEACLYGSLHGWRKDGNYARSVRLLLEAGSPPPRRQYGADNVLQIVKKFFST